MLFAQIFVTLTFGRNYFRSKKSKKYLVFYSLISNFATIIKKVHEYERILWQIGQWLRMVEPAGNGRGSGAAVLRCEVWFGLLYTPWRGHHGAQSAGYDLQQGPSAFGTGRTDHLGYRLRLQQDAACRLHSGPDTRLRYKGEGGTHHLRDCQLSDVALVYNTRHCRQLQCA